MRTRSWLLLWVAVACSGNGAVAAKDINAVLASHRDSLMALPGVVGTAISLCDGERCIKVLITDRSVRSKVPERLDGFRVVTEVTGTIKPR